MHKNIYRFSHAKSMVELHEINKALYDGEQMRQFPEFRNEVEKINVRYNKNYLETEYTTARNAAEHARKWQEYQADKKLFPNLKYMTVADDRVRDEHQALHGIIKPIDDDFWNNYFPPNGWNCRCYTVQTAEKADEGKYEDKTVPQTFIGNVGKTGVIFSKGQSFFQIAKELGTNETNKAFELSKLEVPLIKRYKSPSGAKVNVSPWTDTRPDELSGNYKVAVVLADKEKLNVDLLAHLDGWVVKGKSNPEYRINGKIADRKAPESTNYKKSLSRANEQGCEIVVMDLSKNKDTIENAEAKIDNVLKLDNVHTNIKEVYIVSSDRKTVKHYKRKKQS
jgi:SPP1 gp7 family putative phage head morphogenesis protein